MARVTRATALGGIGANGGKGGDGGMVSGTYVGPGGGAMGSTGGLAEAIATGTTTAGAIAKGIGGIGGDSGAPGADPSGKSPGSGSSGGAGGAGFAVSSEFTSLPGAFANTIAGGGAGGVGYGPGNTGGVGGAVDDPRFLSMATVGDSSLGASATASLVQTGGAGGAGTMGANGGAGASSSAVNVTSGYSNGGLLTLSQNAIGGAGGSSDTGAGGAGGAGVSKLTFNDMLSTTQSASITASSTGVGGAGGTGASNGIGGNGIATLSVIGAGPVTATSTAIGGAGAQTSGTAVATVAVTGVSGVYAANASTSLLPGSLIISDSATASGSVGGTSSAKAVAGIGGMLWTPSKLGQAVSLFEAAPTAASVAAAMKGAPNITAAFTSATSYFGDGELGGSYANGGAATQTVTASFSEQVDLTQLATKQDLVIGLYGATVAGSGIGAATFDVFANGVDVIHQTFANTAAAVAYFTDNAVDVGSLSGISSPLNIRAVLSTTTTSAGSGFFGSILIGDPAKSTHAAVNTFASAIAAMPSGSGAAAATASSSSRPSTALLSLPSHTA